MADGYALQVGVARVELIPAQGARPAVGVQALPVSRAMKRAAYAASSAVLAGMDEAAMLASPEKAGEAGEAFGTALLRARIVGWDGIADREGKVAVPFSPEALEAFLDDEALYEAAYAALVMPVILRDAEKNGLAPSPNGTGAGATPGAAIAGSAARPKAKRGAKTARTAKARRAPTKAATHGK
ncbi:hypothetical protein [Sphingomonas hengshuiensis]|uniref:hypothetical protein n=1 Tax=Sphingomonas hengshuiensis TaxID=1609977 RepID=UPI0006977E7C|nr:hypothetical protein [Sphingomonas hengshuiensis]